MIVIHSVDRNGNHVTLAFGFGVSRDTFHDVAHVMNYRNGQVWFVPGTYDFSV